MCQKQIEKAINIGKKKIFYHKKQKLAKHCRKKKQLKLAEKYL